MARNASHSTIKSGWRDICFLHRRVCAGCSCATINDPGASRAGRAWPDEKTAMSLPVKFTAFGVAAYLAAALIAMYYAELKTWTKVSRDAGLKAD